VPRPLDEEIDRFAGRILELRLSPATAVAVIDNDTTLYQRTYGGVDPGGLWQIGSIGKSFTAVVTLQLVEEGLLDLHAPVTEYLPWFSVKSPYEPIALHHLLTHTGGLIVGSEIAPASTYDVIALSESEPGCAPGEHYWYSNVGYRTVGVVLEQVTGRRYADLVQERVFDRLGMRDSTAAIVHETRKRLVPGYSPFYDDRPWHPEHGLVPATWAESAEADGCICCTTADLATYLRAFMRGGEGILSPESFRMMTTPHAADEQEGGHYGYGLVVEEAALGHTGSMLGYHAAMWADLAMGIGAVTMVNGPVGAKALCDAAIALAKDQQPDELRFTPGKPMTDDGSAPPELAGLVGHYRSYNPWYSNFRVIGRDGSLWLGVEETEVEYHPLTALRDGSFHVGEAPWMPERVRFDTPIDGKAQRAIYSGNPYYRTFTP
jgi:CubicO group peptidase (beta-lactamase class C family)